LPRSRYAAALSTHPVAYEAVGAVAGEVLEQLEGDRPDLLVCFVSRHHIDAFTDITDGLRAILEPDVLAGATAVSIAGGSREIEDEPALSVWAADLGGGHASGFVLDVQPHLDGEGAEGVRVDGWPSEASGDATVLLLADPFSFPVADLLALCNARVPGVRVIGGLASAGTVPGTNRLALDDRIVRRGAVGVVLPPEIAVRTVVSQGCRPVGSPFTVTKSERNLVLELGGRSAIARLEDLVAAADDRDRALLARGLQVGIVVDEHRVDFDRGDFLVRSVLGADQSTGAVTVGEIIEVGQTVQFQVRDADAADEDLAALLGALGVGARFGGALLFTCNGRGVSLFGHADHDTGLIDQQLGPLPLAGAFCAGEIGPIGGHNFLHGFTASIALFG
jgi:small ligand-binding sensory domain FIST